MAIDPFFDPKQTLKKAPPPKTTIAVFVVISLLGWLSSPFGLGASATRMICALYLFTTLPLTLSDAEGCRWSTVPLGKPNTLIRACLIYVGPCSRLTF